MESDDSALQGPSIVNRAPPFERRPICDGVDLHVARARWFQTIAARVRFVEPLDRGATARSLTLGLLRRGSRSAPDLMSLARRLEALYGAAIAFDAERIGWTQTTDYTLRVIRPGALRDANNLLVDGLSALDELIRDPVTENDGFRRIEFEQERLNLERSIRALLDDKAGYAQRRFLSLVFPDDPYGEPELGSLEDLPGLEPVELLLRHRARIAKAGIQIFAIGDLSVADEDALVNLGESYGRRSPSPERLVAFRPAGAGRHTNEIAAGESHLFLGYRFDPARLDARDSLAHSAVASILGGGPHSLLFREVREKRQLAYSTHAHLDRPRGLATIYAAVERESAGLAEETARDQLRRIANDDFDDHTYLAARESLEHALRTALDSPLRAIDFAARAIASGFPPDPAFYEDALSNVTREDVVRAASCWREDVTYCAVGVLDERDHQLAR